MSIGKHTLTNLAGAVVPMLVALATIPHYLVHIGEERYGVLALIWLLLAYFGFVDLGFGRAVSQRVARLERAPSRECSRVVWTGVLATMALGILGGILLYVTAKYLIASHIKLAPLMRDEATASAFWISIALPFILPGAICSGALHARRRFYEANLIQAGGAVVAQVAPLCVAVLGHVQLPYLVATVLLSKALTNIALFFSCWQHVPLEGKPSIDRMHLVQMASYGRWVTVMNIVGALLVVLDRFAIATLMGARAVTYYTLPYDLVTRVTVLSSSISMAVFPRIAAAGDYEGRELAFRASAVLLAIMTPITIVGIILMEPFLSVWVGKEFAARSAGVGEIILIGVWMNAVAVPQHSRFLATNSAKQLAANYMIELMAFVLLLWFGVTIAGIIGAAIAWALRAGLDTILVLRLNGTFAQIAVASAPTMLLLLGTLAVRFTAPSFIFAATAGSALLALALYLHRQVYSAVFRHLRVTESQINADIRLPAPKAPASDAAK